MIIGLRTHQPTEWPDESDRSSQIPSGSISNQSKAEDLKSAMPLVAQLSLVWNTYSKENRPMHPKTCWTAINSTMTPWVISSQAKMAILRWSLGSRQSWMIKNENITKMIENNQIGSEQITLQRLMDEKEAMKVFEEK